MAKKNIKGKFITFEGGEGSGKSTHIEFLKKFLQKKGLKVAVFREPGSTGLGERIRKILLNFKGNIAAETELFLYLAARTQFVKDKLMAALGRYDVIICDRFSDSTLVYQGHALRLGIKKIRMIVEFASFGIKPDLTFVLDLEPKEGLSRIKRKKDRIEARSLEFHNDLRKGYKILAGEEPTRIKIINAKDREYVQQRLIQILEDYV